VSLLEVHGLRTRFATDAGVLQAVDGVDLELEPSRTLALVGESGSGKSVTCLTVMGLLPGAKTHVEGEMRFKGRDLVAASRRELQRIRGNEIAMIFQDPLTSLNPVHRIGAQLVEALRLHRDVSRRDARDRAIEALHEVGIAEPARRVDDFPHEFSGGMRQRVMIAMALINEPDLLIADEPTTALDVTTQAQILALMRRLQADHGMAMIFVTHDLGVVAQIADEVAVMYAGKIVERAPVHAIFKQPRHPYTRGLLASVPSLDGPVQRLRSIPGTPPSLLHPPSGCRFHPRCALRIGGCDATVPPLHAASDNPEHLDACILDEQTKRAGGELGAAADRDEPANPGARADDVGARPGQAA
jgi:peptide/nickel transport system ATP-binding protein